MQILLDHSRDVIVIDDEPTELDRVCAAASSPFASEAHALDSPTPAECLADTRDHGDDAPAEGRRPRYEYRIAGRADRPSDGYWAWDLAEDRPVSWHRWAYEAQAAAEDLNAEDFPDEGPWWATMAEDGDLDARWTLSIAGGGSGLPMTDLDIAPRRRGDRVTDFDQAHYRGLRDVPDCVPAGDGYPPVS